MTVNCLCETTYGIKLNFRKHYRKEISIGGYYSTDDKCQQCPNSVSINWRIKNISTGGLGFTALNRVRAQLGAMLCVKLTLDRESPEIMGKRSLSLR